MIVKTGYEKFITCFKMYIPKQRKSKKHSMMKFHLIFSKL